MASPDMVRHQAINGDPQRIQNVLNDCSEDKTFSFNFGTYYNNAKATNKVEAIALYENREYIKGLITKCSPHAKLDKAIFISLLKAMVYSNSFKPYCSGSLNVKNPMLVKLWCSQTFDRHSVN